MDSKKWYSFILNILPDGKAFRSISYSKILWQVLANGLKLILDYGIFIINDQVWYTNSNFDPEPWEERYNIIVVEPSTLQERQEIVRQYMLYPQSGNRLSRDYILSQIINLGIDTVDVVYNPTGLDDGFLHANDFGNEKNSFNLGALTYNSFTLVGSCLPSQYNLIINMVMSLKPLQVALYDLISVDVVLAWNDSIVLGYDDNVALGYSAVSSPGIGVMKIGSTFIIK